MLFLSSVSLATPWFMLRNKLFLCKQPTEYMEFPQQIYLLIKTVR